MTAQKDPLLLKGDYLVYCYGSQSCFRVQAPPQEGKKPAQFTLHSYDDLIRFLRIIPSEPSFRVPEVMSKDEKAFRVPEEDVGRVLMALEKRNELKTLAARL